MSLKDNSAQVLAELQKRIDVALEKCGLLAEGYAQLKCPADTGNLRNSITHKTSKDEMVVGTNVEYAAYVEYGTGKYSEKGGRQTPWVYKDSEGNWHYTEGMKPRPYIKPSIADHLDKYKQVIQQELKG